MSYTFATLAGLCIILAIYRFRRFSITGNKDYLHRAIMATALAVLFAGKALLDLL
jgi:hypothetical protein